MNQHTRAATAPIPFIDVAAQRRRLGRAIDDAVARVLDHCQFIMGPEVRAAEADLAAFCGARHAITCASGTDALLLPLMARGIGRGDAVVCPGFTFHATAEVVALVGATPIFADVEEASFNIDLRSVEQALVVAHRLGLKPKAVIPVDLFGQPADYDAIGEIARAENLFVLGDAAQSFGALCRNRAVGTLAQATATSFFPAKPLGAYGDGGAIFTDDAGKADLYRSIRFHGSSNADRYEILRIGTNGRLDTIQAAILTVKLEAYPSELAHREAVARRYDEKLPAAVRRPARNPGSASAWPLYVVETPRRDDVKAALARQGIPTAIYYPKPLHFQVAYARYGAGAGSLPVAESLCGRVLALPMHSDLDLATVDRIAAALDEALR